MKTKTLSFIGGGRITKIFLQGFKNVGIKFSSVKVYDINADTLKALKKSFPDIEITTKLKDLALQEVIFIALHPPVIKEVLEQLKDHLNKKAIIISLAPKFNIQKLSALTACDRIVRMIPNASSFINQGYNPICFSEKIDEKDQKSIIELLGELGHTFIAEEKQLEAYAIASAMLPTYFWFQWNALQKISEEMGLSKQESRDCIYTTSKVALELMYNSNLEYHETLDLIPVKPLQDEEEKMIESYNSILLALYNRIKA